MTDVLLCALIPPPILSLDSNLPILSLKLKWLLGVRYEGLVLGPPSVVQPVPERGRDDVDKEVEVR